jgi:cell division protein FtsB
MFSKQSLSSKIALCGLLALLVFLADLKYRQFKAQNEIASQEQSLQAQADVLQKKNDELNQSLQYLNSPDFKERVARQDLGLKKQGETVYNFGDPPPASNALANGEPKLSNLQKWRDYFFASSAP